MVFNYIIIQAGGKGTRLRPFTQNKPKGIVPVYNLPIIFHLFRLFPKKHFIIIGDYLFDVLEKYLSIFADVDYRCIKAEKTGTCAGLSDAIKAVPDGEPFMLTWSDLVFHPNFDASSVVGNTIGLSTTFECRWSFEDNRFVEEKSVKNGVSGVFFFENKSFISSVPDQGEFVRFLSETKIAFNSIPLVGVEEIGTVLAYSKAKQQYVCRPFNSLQFLPDRVIKTPVNEVGKDLQQKEEYWYKILRGMGYKDIPQVFSYNPLIIERIPGNNAFNLNFTDDEKIRVVTKIVSSLSSLHSLSTSPASPADVIDTYFSKTYRRIEPIKNLVPFATQKELSINNITCVSPFYLKDKIEKIIRSMMIPKCFCPIHGDPTFSNIIVKPDLTPILIDPRGYFGDSLIFGDPLYDWAKLYYSIFGNYDQFNRGNFTLEISQKDATISVQSNGFDTLAEDYLSRFPIRERTKIQFLHALIWLSLTTYAWEDYDSICGSFYLGTLFLNKALALIKKEANP